MDAGGAAGIHNAAGDGHAGVPLNCRHDSAYPYYAVAY